MCAPVWRKTFRLPLQEASSGRAVATESVLCKEWKTKCHQQQSPHETYPKTSLTVSSVVKASNLPAISIYFYYPGMKINLFHSQIINYGPLTFYNYEITHKVHRECY